MLAEIEHTVTAQGFSKRGGDWTRVVCGDGDVEGQQRLHSMHDHSPHGVAKSGHALLARPPVAATHQHAQSKSPEVEAGLPPAATTAAPAPSPAKTVGVMDKIEATLATYRFVRVVLRSRS